MQRILQQSLTGGTLLIGALTLFCIGCGGESADKGLSDASASRTDETQGVELPGEPTDDGGIPEPGTVDPPEVDVDRQGAVTVQLSEPPESAPPESTEPQVAGEVTAVLEDWRTWEDPQVVFLLTGQQYGYIEPCGCTGLANQKGGLMRRGTLLSQIRGKGWDVIPLDAGNQVRRSGRQASIKFQTAVKGLQELGYQAIGFGPNDLGLGASELLSVAADDGETASGFASANIELLAPDLVPTYRRLEAGGRVIGVTSVIDPEQIASAVDEAIIISDMKEKLSETLVTMKSEGCEFNIALLFGDEDQAKTLAKEVPGFDLIVAAATFGEPRYQAELVEGTNTRVIKTGDKGMYAGVVGLFAEGPPRYARQPLDAQFEDSQEMLDLMAAYQSQLKSLGLDGLQVKPIPHPSGFEYVGTEKCGECHKTAYEIWQGTPHAEATEDIVHPGERSEIARHFDPECLSCHVTGWNPQSFYPYTTGYLSLETTPLMAGSGCENCHGPGKAHVDAEEGIGSLTEAEIEALREAVRLPLERARERCLECHDLDNSPDFHKDGAFDDYWSQVEHYGVD